MKRDFNFRRSFAPIKVGDEIDVQIEAVGEKGDGIAKVKGFVLFVPNTKQGDNVKIKVTRVLKNVGFAEVVGEATSDADKEPEQETSEEQQEEEKSEETEEEPSEDQEETEEDTGDEEEGSEDF
jgi:predicted RNA-binding protein with TRAM domain